ncbi:hypothetical protein [Streptomyces sp. NPDC059224]|uniref:hypothetical protein n=1 Tax=Streptomyces sp. NPDC059224 TaxID=3346775 RepID=UPI0036C60C06
MAGARRGVVAGQHQAPGAGAPFRHRQPRAAVGGGVPVVRSEVLGHGGEFGGHVLPGRGARGELGDPVGQARLRRAVRRS